MRTVLVCFVALAFACDRGKEDARGPVLNFTVPDAGAILWKPEQLSVSGAGVHRVEFRLDDQLRFTDDAPPFEWTLEPAACAPGVHDLTVLAETGSGRQSRRVRLILVPSPEHPTLAFVSPRTGALAGGASILLTGTNFTAGATVSIGGVAADDVQVVSGTEIRCRAPAAVAPDRVDLTVATADGAFTYTRVFRYVAPGSVTGRFPLSVDRGGRHLARADGQPFLIHGDTPWSLAVQLTEREVDVYLEDRQRKGFNTILFNAFEAYFSSQTPAYRNANGDDPFGTMSPVDFTDPDESYWTHLDYIVDEAKARGIVCIIAPAYLGYNGGKEGWHSDVERTSDADLKAYGEFLAQRYAQGNVIWCMGGDYVPSDVTRQWTVVEGIRNIRGTDLVTAHGSRSKEEAYPGWKDQTGFNLNNIYGDGVEYDLAATAYARGGPIPFFLIEGYYDGESATPADCRRQAYVSILSGACGHFFGNNPIWGFGEPHFNGGEGAAAALANHVSTPATLQMVHVPSLFEAQEWWKLEPRTGSDLVTSYLGSGEDRICPALANDGSFAMIWSRNSGAVTVDLSALKPDKVRARFFDTIDGTCSTVTGSPFANTGTRDFDWPGERVLVLDGEPE